MSNVDLSNDTVLAHLIAQAQQVLGDRSGIGRRAFSQVDADNLFRLDPEINRLLIQSRLIKKTIARLGSELNNPVRTQQDKENILNTIENQREVLKLARNQIRHRKQTLDQLIVLRRRVGSPDWDIKRPGVRLSQQVDAVLRIGKYIDDKFQSAHEQNTDGQLLADLKRSIDSIDAKLSVLGISPMDAVQKKLLLRQKARLQVQIDQLSGDSSVPLSQQLLAEFDKLRPLNHKTFFPLDWNNAYPPLGIGPLQRAFNFRLNREDSDFLPNTLRDLFLSGKSDNKDEADWALGVITVL